MLDDPPLSDSNLMSSSPRAQAELDGKLLGTQLEALQKAKAESDEQARRRVTARECGNSGTTEENVSHQGNANVPD